VSDERTTDIGEEIDAAITGRMYGMFTGLPGRVLAFNATEQTATIQPEPATYQGDVVVQLPALHDVPVKFPQGGGFRLTWPLVAGDRVWLSFACRPLDAWKAGAGSEPGGIRSHALSDATAAPMGPRPIADALAAFNTTDAELLEPTGGKVALGSTPRQAVARHGDTINMGLLAPGDWLAFAGQVATYINAIAPGSITPPTTAPTVIASSAKVEAG